MEYRFFFGEFRSFFWNSKKRIMPHPQRHWYLRIWVLDELSNKLGDLTQGQKRPHLASKCAMLKLVHSKL